MGLNVDNPHIETGDRGNALQDWRVVGASAENTDRGRLYVRKTGANLELFKAFGAAPADLVATGVDANVADVVMAPANGSGLTATVYRTGGAVESGITLYVWLCSELDLRENADDLDALLLHNEVGFEVPLKQMMREFLTQIAGKFPPPPRVGRPLSWSPPTVEAGTHGDQEFTTQFFWELNRRGQWELSGLQNPDDYREWAIQQALSKIYFRKARAHDPADPWWTRYVSTQSEATRLMNVVEPWLDIDRNLTPDRSPKTRSIRVRRG